MRFVILRILLPLFLFLLLRYVLRSIFTGSEKSDIARKRSDGSRAPAAGGALKKDPVCGTYVAANAGIIEQDHGETLYFCSEECRKKYRAA